jgi:hypothetical protein
MSLNDDLIANPKPSRTVWPIFDQSRQSKLKIEFQVVRTAEDFEEWAVEGIDDGSEGEVYRTLFVGSCARDRALEYARYKNSAACHLSGLNHE